MWTSAVLLIPLLPLLTTLIVVAGEGEALRNRVKIAVWASPSAGP
jgi:NADH-quinone oxidoreductase subunit L